MSDEKNNEEKKERRFSQEQYDMLMRCSEKKDVTEWNEWRDKNRDVEILLEGADLSGAYLEGADMTNAHLERAHLFFTHLECASISSSHLEGAMVLSAYLMNAELLDSNLEGAKLMEAHLEGATFRKTELRDANFEKAIVDGETLIWDSTYNRKTSFYGVGLRSARVEPNLRSYLEGNNRHFKWLEWYKEHRFLRLIIQPFWWMSDYGRSAPRVVATFFILAALFACVYWQVPGLVHDIHGPEVESVETGLQPLRAIYFSVVTMTTLGFGDMHAAPGSVLGHILLMFQVLLGYVMLAALVSRLAVLFQEG